MAYIFKKAADDLTRSMLQWTSWNLCNGNETGMRPSGAEKDWIKWKTLEWAKPCRPWRGKAPVWCWACCCYCQPCSLWKLPRKPPLQRLFVSARLRTPSTMSTRRVQERAAAHKNTGSPPHPVRWYKKLHRLAQRNRTRCFYESIYEILLKIHHGGGKIIL